MTSADWTALVTAIVGVLGATGAWLRALAAQKTADEAHTRLDLIDSKQEPKA